MTGPAVVGVDVSTKHIALAAPALHWVCKVRAKPATAAIETRVSQLAVLALRALDGQLGPTGLFVFLEAPVVAGARNLQASLKLAMVSGALIGGLNGKVTLVPVATWKMTVIGNGNASKEHVRNILTARSPQLAAACDADQDLVDATCVALYGTARLAQGGSVPLCRPDDLLR